MLTTLDLIGDWEDFAKQMLIYVPQPEPSNVKEFSQYHRGRAEEPSLEFIGILFCLLFVLGKRRMTFWNKFGMSLELARISLTVFI